MCFGVCSFGLDIVLLPLFCLLHLSLYTLPRPHVLLPFDSRSYFLFILFPWLNPHLDILMVTEPESIRGGSSTQRRPPRRLGRETTHDDTRSIRHRHTDIHSHTHGRNAAHDDGSTLRARTPHDGEHTKSDNLTHDCQDHNMWSRHSHERRKI